MVDSAGEVLYAQGFDPYGNPYLSAGTDRPGWGFTGEQSDENGLVFLRARYYEPRQGRFLSQDPFSGSVDYPATLNPYIYALNNPLLHTDPNGENPLLAALIPALVGLGVTMAGGAIAAGTYGYLTYNWALTGECGCEIQQQASSMTRWEWTGAHALSGGIIAGTATALAAAGPAGLIVVGGVGVVVSFADFIHTAQIMKNETGITACTATRLLLDTAGAVLSVVGIREGVRAWRTSGSGLMWASFDPLDPGRWGPRQDPRSGAAYEEYVRQNFGNPSESNYYLSNGTREVAFDAWDKGSRHLIDAKYSSGNSNYDKVLSQEWAKVNIRKEAIDQLAAAKLNNLKVAWYVSNSNTVNKLNLFFTQEGLPINVIYFHWP